MLCGDTEMNGVALLFPADSKRIGPARREGKRVTQWEGAAVGVFFIGLRVECEKRYFQQISIKIPSGFLPWSQEL